ncbi:uncharacterized protein LOC144867180 isoform X2 [Branchiostoma floridae x Branchiostoma japonicum]
MTSIISGKTQLEFQLPLGSGGVHRYHGNLQRFPGNLPPTSSHPGRDGRPFALQKQNQLAFNVDMAAAADSLTKRYRKPSAVVVEKLGTSPVKRNDPSAASAGQISLLSQEKLSQALFLARRDNAKRRRNDQVINMADVATTDSEVREDSEEDCNIDVAQERNTRRNRPQQQNNTEAIRGRKQGKTGRKPASENLLVSPPRVKQRHRDMPASPGLVLRLAGDSPEGLPGDSPVLPVDKPSRQVRKLQRELQRYIRELEGHLTQGQVPSPSKRKRRGSVEKISDTEDDPRSEVRRQEQLTRAGRMVYTLQHQIAEVEQDLSRPTSEKTKQARKARVLKKLGAAHRAAVKVIQVFIQQLPDQYSGGGGLPAVYQDLGHVIKQLSQVSAQLQVGSAEVMSVESLLQLLGRTQVQPKPSAEVTAHKRAPEGRVKVKTRRGQPVWKDRPARTAYPGPKLHPAHRLEEDMSQLLHQETNDGDPEREDILRAGIAALRRTSTRTPGKVQRLTHPARRRGVLVSPKSKRTPRRPPHSPVGEHTLASWAKVKPPLPYMGKENRTPPPSPPPQHVRYRERSLSPRESSLKPHKSPRVGSAVRRSLNYRDTYRNQEVLERRREEITDPSRTSQDARRNLDFKEEYRNPGGVDRSRDNLPYSPSRHSQDIRRNVDLRNLYENPDMEKKGGEIPEDSSSHLRTSLGALRSRDLKSVYGGYQGPRKESRGIYGGFEETGGREERDVYGGFKRAGERGGEHEGLYGGFQDGGLRREADRDERQYLDRRKQLGDNLPVLRNAVLEEVLEDTTAELQRLEGQRSAQQEVIALQDMSTLNNILQKLQLVEEEEELIRRRWIRAEYANEMDHIWARYRTAREAWPPTPPRQPEHWSEGRHEGRFHGNMPDSLSFRREGIPDSTAAQSGHPWTKETGVKDSTGAGLRTAVAGAPPTLLFTPAGQMQDLRAYRRSFDQHRRRTSHESAGAFNPWRLVDQLADELMEDVLDAVVMEMTDACEECVENVYRSEFT